MGTCNKTNLIELPNYLVAFKKRISGTEFLLLGSEKKFISFFKAHSLFLN